MYDLSIMAMAVVTQLCRGFDHNGVRTISPFRHIFVFGTDEVAMVLFRSGTGRSEHLSIVLIT
jgi:hypothetical protein